MLALGDIEQKLKKRAKIFVSYRANLYFFKVVRSTSSRNCLNIDFLNDYDWSDTLMQIENAEYKNY